MQEGKLNSGGEERANEIILETGCSRFADPSGEDILDWKEQLEKRKAGALDFQMQMYSESTL